MNPSSQGSETVRYDFDRTTEDPTLDTINAIAAIENVPLTDLILRLHDHTNPEALNKVVDSTSEVSVTFSADPYRVQVSEGSNGS